MDLIHKDEAAEFLGISMDTLEGLMRQRRIPYYRLSQKCVRFDKEDLVTYILQSRVEAKAPEAKRTRRSWKPRENVYVPGMEVV